MLRVEVLEDLILLECLHQALLDVDPVGQHKGDIRKSVAELLD